MPDIPEERPRPTPRPRPGTAVRPAPRPRVAGSRRDRDETEPGTRAVPAPRPGARPATARPAGEPASGKKAPAKTAATSLRKAGTTPSARRSTRAVAVEQQSARRRGRGLALTLAVLCVLALAGGGFLLWQRLASPYVTPSVFTATRAAVTDLYAFDYKDAKGSVARKLAVLTGDLRDQYKKDLGQGGIIDSAEQVSATTRLDVTDVGLQQINDAQDAATLVVFGNYVTKSVNSGSQPAPEGSTCQVTAEGAQSCREIMRVHVIRVDGAWKIDEVTVLTGT